MQRRIVRPRPGIGIVPAVRRGALAAQAQQFDLNACKGLVDADSSETVPVRTHITMHNWQKYHNFFRIGEQALYSGKYQFHVGGPEYGGGGRTDYQVQGTRCPDS